jgi:hypothetical protein
LWLKKSEVGIEDFLNIRCVLYKEKMAEKDVVFATKLKHGGLFNFKDFYSFVYDWLTEQGYSVSEGAYSEKVTGDQKSIDISWSASKKISDYFKFTISVSWMILGMKNVEVEKEGQKIKMNTGALEMKFKGVIVKDYESRWEDNPVWKFMRGIYDRYIIKSRIDEYESKLAGEVDELVSQCKAFLALEAR